MTVVLVTGATQGLGLALVEGVAAHLGEGDTVYLTGRDLDRARRACDELRASAADVRAELLDVSSDASVMAKAQVLRERHGWVDVVISNAYHRVLPSDRAGHVIDAYVAVNNVGTTRVLRAFAPLIADRGTLLVVASTLGTLHYLAPVLHQRFDDAESLEDIDSVVLDWSDAVKSGRANAEAWPSFINIPSKVGQVAAVRALSQQRREHDLERGVLLATVCPGMIDTAASRPWFDMTGAHTPQEAARALLALIFRDAVDPAFYGELIRFGRVLPWKP